MNRIIASLTILCFLSCSEVGKDQMQSTQGSDAAVPPGAVVESFDGSDIAAAVVKDGSGNLAESGTLQSGKKVGNWTEYYPNGLVKTVTSYVNGMKEGLRVELNNSGQMEKRMNYHEDLLHGEYKEFKYSTLKEERFYQDGKLEGTVKIYYDNGKIMEEGAYKNGTRDGVSKWYDQEGNVTIEYEYKNGQLVKK